MSEKLNVKSAKIRGNKTLYAIALILMLTIAATLVALPVANAHTPAWTLAPRAFISVVPNPAQVGQPVFVNFWLDMPPPTAAGAYGDRWHGFKVTAVKPDGSTQTLSLGSHSSSDAVGGSYTTYTPTAAGNYTFVFSFPGQTLTGENPNPSTGTSSAIFVGDYFQPVTSDPVTLTVQQEAIQRAPDTPLPTSYWQRPIYAENTGWYNISGNWLGYNCAAIGGYSGGGSYDLGQNIRLEGNFNPYTTAPNSAHIVWTRQYAPGGLLGGSYGGDQMTSMHYSVAQYETKFAPIVMNGVLYYGLMPGASTNRQGWVAVNLRTGETIWTKETSAVLNSGQILDYVSPNQFGGLEYLWSVETTVAPNRGSTYGLYDAMTGKWILNIVNATSNPSTISTSAAALTFLSDKGGNLIAYYIDSTSKTLNMWNSTRAILKGTDGKADLANAWTWRPVQGASYPFQNGIQWTAPMAATMTASNGSTVDINKAYAEAAGSTCDLAVRRVDQQNGVVVLMTITTGFTDPGWIIMEGYSTTTGQLLWGPLNHTIPAWSRIADQGGGEGVMSLYINSERSWYTYSITTGELVWGPLRFPDNSWSYYQMHGIVAYGNLYTADFGGYVNCIDAKTGTLKWTWNTGSSGYETPYGVWPIINFECIADGKLYFVGGHTYSPPLFHGSRLWCVDAFTGQELWNISDFGITSHAAFAIADGYMLVPNAYDNQIYCYNKGLSATTVSAPDTAIPLGTPVLIKGTVTDQSPGQTCLGIPAAGTPAISDDSMTAWMEYLYQQQPKPTNAKGVRVHLTAYDPNGNFQEIGTTTTDANGKYGTTWAPQIEGTYHITATFESTNSYYSSEDTTYLAVGSAASPVATATPTLAPTATPTPTATAAPTASPSAVPIPSEFPYAAVYISAAAVVIIIAIAAVAVILRKRK